MIRFLVTIFIFNIMTFSSMLVNAHPHIFIDGYYRVIVDDSSIENLEAMWLVDDFTSSSIIMGYDLDLDGQILGAEKEELIEAFDSFNEQGYFLKIEQDGQQLLPRFVKIADLEVRDGQLWLRLEILLPEIVDLRTSTLSLAFGDDTMYTAVIPDIEGLVQLSGRDAENCTPIPRLSDDIIIDSWGDLKCY